MDISGRTDLQVFCVRLVTLYVFRNVIIGSYILQYLATKGFDALFKVPKTYPKKLNVTVLPRLVLVYIVNARRSPDTTPLPFKAFLLRFRLVNTDIIGPLTPEKLYRYCLTSTDHFSRWVLWIDHCRRHDTSLLCWLDSGFGSPEKITTGQGREFESQFLKHLDMFTAFKFFRTTSYLPCANEMIERVHRQLNASLMCHPDSSWFEALPVVLLGIRSAFKEDLQFSSAELVYGEPLNLLGEFISPLPTEMPSISASAFDDQLRTHIGRLRPVSASCHARSTPFVFKDLEICTYAMLRDDFIRGDLQHPYSGPFRILQGIGKGFVFRIGTNEVRVSVDSIKRAYVLADDPPSSGSSLPTQSSLRPTIATSSGRLVHFTDFFQA
ncbi:integrase catalytic domain-containing protein [Trichonephila clavata]|uniref:Integrase catalytic domain-containing protein n=1 Tax=Trichonephila clavata TaxID=2740835 RepID=A0A8X6LNX9_TRICU|nr:integrase catalytic domain-containing protein [Trichonephila clavata]